MTLPSAWDMTEVQFQRHLAADHPWLAGQSRYAHNGVRHGSGDETGHVHQRKGEPPEPVSRHDAMQEALNFPAPVCRAARDMEIPVFMAHARRLHGRVFNTISEHDALHLNWPDQQSHVHKQEES